MDPGQLLEWWVLYNDEPWGDTRADLRSWAQVLMGMGAKDLTLTWPYCAPEWTMEEIQDEMTRIEQALEHVDSGKDQHCD